MRSLFIKRPDFKISNKYYLLVQEKWVKKMEQLFDGLSKRKTLIILSFFVSFTTCICIYFIYRGLNGYTNYIGKTIISKTRVGVLKQSNNLKMNFKK